MDAMVLIVRRLEEAARARVIARNILKCSLRLLVWSTRNGIFRSTAPRHGIRLYIWNEHLFLVDSQIEEHRRRQARRVTFREAADHAPRKRIYIAALPGGSGRPGETGVEGFRLVVDEEPAEEEQEGNQNVQLFKPGPPPCRSHVRGRSEGDTARLVVFSRPVRCHCLACVSWSLGGGGGVSSDSVSPFVLVMLCLLFHVSVCACMWWFGVCLFFLLVVLLRMTCAHGRPGSWRVASVSFVFLAGVACGPRLRRMRQPRKLRRTLSLALFLPLSLCVNLSLSLSLSHS